LNVDAAVDDNITRVRVAGTLSGEWSCNAVKSIAAMDIVETGLILSQPPDTKVKVLALGKLTARGWIDSSKIDSSGHIGTITAGAIADSTCFAGVSDGVFGQPDPETDINYIQPAIMKSISIKGIRTESPNYFINSNIAASQILRAYLFYPENNNEGISFGLSSGFIKLVKIKDAEETVTFKNLDKPSDSKEFEFSDVKIRLY
jgi:hypothetical protein